METVETVLKQQKEVPAFKTHGVSSKRRPDTRRMSLSPDQKLVNLTQYKELASSVGGLEGFEISGLLVRLYVHFPL